MKSVINICFSADDNYVMALATTMASLLKNSHDNVFHNIYILDDGISAENKIKIEELKSIKGFNITYIAVDRNDYNDCILTVSHISLPTYYRFKIPSYLPELDKILYLDCDIIVQTDLQELWDTDISGYFAAGAEDIFNNASMKRLRLTNSYVNAGVLLININKWREYDIEKKLFDFVCNNQEKIVWVDQDVINSVLNNKILILDDKWNYQYIHTSGITTVSKTKYYYTPLSNPAIVHFVGADKPWLAESEVLYKELWWEYNALTAWKAEIPSKPKNKRGILKTIFSMTREGVYKVITIFGIRIRIRQEIK